MSVDQVLATNLEVILGVEHLLFFSCCNLEDDVENFQLLVFLRQLVLEFVVLLKLLLDYGEINI